jgi:hypothetical protein
MVFLDNLITDSSLLLRAMKTILYCTLVLKINTKKIRETRKFESFHVEHFEELKNECRKLDKTQV